MAEPQPEGMPERLRARLGAGAGQLPDPFDTNDARHVDAAASALLKRFYADNDAASFELLVELTLPLLNAACEDVARETGLAAGAQTLLTGLFSKMFVSVRPPVGLLDAPFLGWVVRRARESADARIEALASRRIPVAETDDVPQAPDGGPPAPSDPDANAAAYAPRSETLSRLAEATAPDRQLDLAALGLSMSRIIEVVFHRLSREHRCILRCVEVARMSDKHAGLFLGIPDAEVQQRNARARGELQAGVGAILEALSAKLGCGLAGDSAGIDAQQLAGHLVECEACAGDVELMQSLGDVPGWLTSVQERPDGASRVEQVLAAANANGTEELAKLLYELVRACVKAVDTSRSIRFIEEPESIDRLVDSAARIDERSRARGKLRDADRRNHLRTARRCQSLLQSISPESLRTRWANARLTLAEGNFGSALGQFETLATSAELTDELRGSARVSMMRCLLALDHLDDVLDLAEGMIERNEQPRWAALYHVWVAAQRGNTELFHRGSALFKAAPYPPGPRDWWSDFISSEAPAIARQLGMEVGAVLHALGEEQS